jgi:glycerol-3-phosphate dehydrogenase
MAEASDRRPPAAVDLLIIGGGITGAGILEAASHAGLSTLLVDRADFASGTSSASSKLVHGGLRYLAHGHWRLTWESVRERARLLRDLPGLVQPQPFLMPVYEGQRPGRALLRVGLAVYDAMAGHARSQWMSASQALAAEPTLLRQGLLGALRYEDAQTDDARLVLRLIFEAQRRGARAINYMSAERLREDDASIVGARLRDELSGERHELRARVVMEACGPQCGALSHAISVPRLRPLRGSHLLFSARRFALRHAVSWLHPRDRRPVFAFPWEGATLCGTTDVDHVFTEQERPRIAREEFDYLLEALAHQFPDLALNSTDVLATYAGVRPVIAGGQADPSAESRESALWSEPGHVLVTGGKLTTFRVTARRALAAAGLVGQLPKRARSKEPMPRELARYGPDYSVWKAAQPEALRQTLPGSEVCWAELRWAAEHEHVQHLDDLLLRRLRIGLTLADGGVSLLPLVRVHCAAALDWDEARWQAEEIRYRGIWGREHGLP